MKKIQKIMAAVLACALAASLTGCSGDDASSQPSSTSSTVSKASSLVTDAVVADQLALPQAGEEVAVFTVQGYGTFKCRLFPEAAPKAVENFKQLARQGKYNGVTFHRVIQDFMIQSGGESDSIYGDPFGVELNASLHHYNGALAAARTQSYTAGQSAQFYVVSSTRAKSMTNDDFSGMAQQVTQSYQQQNSPITLDFPQQVIDNYHNVGGYPGLDMQYTVFGQTFEGMEVINAIAACPKSSEIGSDGSQSVPEPNVILESVSIEAYQG